MHEIMAASDTHGLRDGRRLKRGSRQQNGDAGQIA
jgi:hypothetical protein